MKARVLKKLLNDTGYQIADRGSCIAVGSPLCPNLISVDKKTLRVKYALDTFNTGRKSLDGHKELGEIWDKLHELVASGEIKDIIEGRDDIPNPLPVYTVEDGQFIESTTDEYGWPNVTVDGKPMFDNTHFKTKGEAIARGIEDTISIIKWTDGHLVEVEAKLAKTKERHARDSKRLDNLRALQAEGEKP